MTTAHPTHKSISPIVCTPWCQDGDGHPNEHNFEDQTCWGDAAYVPLSLEPADVDQAGDPYPARVGAMAHRLHPRVAAEVYLHADLPEWNLDVAAHLTAVEARALAEALTAAADQVDGIELNDDRVRDVIVDTHEGRTEDYQLRDVRHRIRNILGRFPASSWDLAESEAVLAALARIVQGRPEGERLA
jgi:hypothetical protein